MVFTLHGTMERALRTGFLQIPAGLSSYRLGNSVVCHGASPDSKANPLGGVRTVCCILEPFQLPSSAKEWPNIPERR